MSVFPMVLKGARDLSDGLAAYEIWSFMGWQDIRQRYRRTVLGPWWLAISTGSLVLALAVVWSELFHAETQTFLPFFVTGYVLWLFLSGVITESCSGFTQFEGLIKQQPIPLSVYLYRLGVRHLIILAHNSILIVIVALWSDISWSPSLYAIPGLAVFIAAVLMISVPVAIVCTRFRDMPPIVANLLQMALFFTPVFWRPESLVNYRWVAEYNPVARLIDVVRLPLLGTAPGPSEWVWSIGVLLVASAFGAWLLGRCGHRIAYWL